jgi:hypothetical protein
MSDKNSTIQPDSTLTDFNLIALWAVSEAGMGGILHAFHAPFKGVVLSCFALTCISLLAWHHKDRPFATIVRAWAIVMTVKFAVAPLSPLTAYVAVTFQAFFSWCCFRYIRHFPTACMVAAVVCLLESALQRLLLVTVAFGVEIWQGKSQLTGAAMMDKMVLGMAQKSVPLMVIYVAIHFVAGIITGWLSGRLPRDVDRESTYLAGLATLPTLQLTEKQQRKADKAAQRAAKRATQAPWRPYVFPLILTIIGVVNMLQGKGGYSLLRLAVFFLIFFTPFVQQYLVQWIQSIVFRISNPYQNEIKQTTAILPELRHKVKLAWQIAKTEERNRLRRWRRFVALVFALQGVQVGL